MSYFSRVLMPAGLWLHDPALKRVDPLYRDHQLIWKLFPDDPEHPRDFLFRAETGFNATGPASASVYYLVSARPPQAWHADVQLLTKPYAPKLQAGELVQFSLRANPTLSCASAHGVRGKRHDVLMHAKTQARAQGLSADAIPARVAQAAADWLQQRAAQWGLQLDAPSLQLDPYRQHRLYSKGREIRFSSVDYQGLAEVTDPHRLAAVLTGQPPTLPGGGLGHAQAFGCGLLLVKRLP